MGHNIAWHDGELKIEVCEKEIELFVNTFVAAYRAAAKPLTVEILNDDATKDGSGQYAGDRTSLDFVSTLLDYLKSCKGSSERDMPGGSILTDLNQSRSPIDENKEHFSDTLHIIESKEPTKSTVRSEVSLIGGGRSR